MLSLNLCSLSFPCLLHCGSERMERSKSLQVAMKPINRALNKSHVWKVGASDFQGLQKIDWINSRSYKSFKEKYVRFALENAYESEFQEKEKEEDSTKSQNFLWKKLKAFFVFTRPYALVGTLVFATSSSLLPVQTFKELSPALFVEILKAAVTAALTFVYASGINQLNDIEIDKVNKPYLPLASGDLSIEAGVAITFAGLSTSLVLGIMLSPAIFFGTLISVFTASANAIDHPLLRWKKHPVLAVISHIFMGVCFQLSFFIHIQKYVLGKPVMVTRSLLFAMVSAIIHFAVIILFKDIPDEEGDKKFGIQTLSLRIGKENLFWLCVKALLMTYGAAMVVGATSSSLLSRLTTIIGHFLLASSLLFQAQSVDLTNNKSTATFYMLIWKLLFIECLLTLFVR